MNLEKEGGWDEDLGDIAGSFSFFLIHFFIKHVYVYICMYVHLYVMPVCVYEHMWILYIYEYI